MILIDGKHIAQTIRAELRQEVQSLLAKGQRAPHLTVVIVGHNPASETYVASKLRACQEVGIAATRLAFEDDITTDELLQHIHRLNQDKTVDGFMVQLPLPEHIDEQQIVSAIDYRKDVDGLHPENVGRTLMGLPSIVPATPRGIRELLRRYDIPTAGKHIVVVGRSNIVGKPMAMLLLQKGDNGDATVTVCHSRTHNLKEICLTADIIVVATGQPGLLKADMVRKGVVIIDVGCSRVEDSSAPRGYRVCGDVDFEQVAPLCSYITPVPGGVGPMTIISLLQNTLQAYYSHRQ